MQVSHKDGSRIPSFAVSTYPNELILCKHKEINQAWTLWEPEHQQLLGSQSSCGVIVKKLNISNSFESIKKEWLPTQQCIALLFR